MWLWYVTRMGDDEGQIKFGMIRPNNRPLDLHVDIAEA